MTEAQARHLIEMVFTAPVPDINREKLFRVWMPCGLQRLRSSPR